MTLSSIAMLFICWILKVCIILGIVYCSLFTITLACGLLVLMDFKIIPNLFATIDMNSAERFLL